MPLQTDFVDQTDDAQEASFSENPLQHVRELYTRFLQGVFSARPVGNYQWRPDDKHTEVCIVNENPLNPLVYGQRPIMTLTRSEVQFQSLGLDDMIYTDVRTGMKRKSVLIPGAMTISVCSRVDQESENLAMIVADSLWSLRDVLQRMGFFHVGQNIRVGAPGPPGSIMANDAGKEWYCTRVLSPFQFVRTNQITPLNQDVFQHVQAQLRPMVPQEPAQLLQHPLDPSRVVVALQTRPYARAPIPKGRTFRL